MERGASGGGGRLAECIYTPDGLVYAGSFPGIDVLCDRDGWWLTALPGCMLICVSLPNRTVGNMATFMDTPRGMHEQDPLAFEVCVRHVASVIEDQRRKEGHTDPREDLAP